MIPASFLFKDNVAACIQKTAFSFSPIIIYIINILEYSCPKKIASIVTQDFSSNERICDPILDILL